MVYVSAKNKQHMPANAPKPLLAALKQIDTCVQVLSTNDLEQIPQMMEALIALRAEVVRMGRLVAPKAEPKGRFALLMHEKQQEREIAELAASLPSLARQNFDTLLRVRSNLGTLHTHCAKVQDVLKWLPEISIRKANDVLQTAIKDSVCRLVVVQKTRNESVKYLSFEHSLFDLSNSLDRNDAAIEELKLNVEKLERLVS